jgi:hypothetical protein
VTSVLSKALALSAEARRLRQGQQGAAETERVANNIAALSVVIERAHSIADIHRSFGAKGLPLQTPLNRLDSGRGALAARAAAGLPSDQAFVAARRKLEQAINEASADLKEAWQSWGSHHLGEIDWAKLALLPAADRLRAAELQQQAKVLVQAAPSKAGPGALDNMIELVKDILGSIEDVPSDVANLLQRLDARPSPTLADFTMFELETLHTTGIAEQVEVRRR